jgi:hypothetical protein
MLIRGGDQQGGSVLYNIRLVYGTGDVPEVNKNVLVEVSQVERCYLITLLQQRQRRATVAPGRYGQHAGPKSSA